MTKNPIISAEAPALAGVSRSMDAKLAFSDALSWERHCMKQSGPVTWADMADAAHLMVRLAAQAIDKD